MKKMILNLLPIFICATSWGAPVIKYTGHFSIDPNVIHKDGVQCAVQLAFEGDILSKVQIKTEAVVYGRTDFPSVEQAMMSAVVANQADIAVIYRLQGPPHKWYFLYLASSSDLGKTYKGTVYKATASLSDIQATLVSGVLPASWMAVGTGTLASSM